MGFSLPGSNLYYLKSDHLKPEKYQQIIRPFLAWDKIEQEYVFDDRWISGFQLINMKPRAFNGYNNQLPPQGKRERDKLKRMVYCGEVVMIGGFYVTHSSLFYINSQGDLICRDPFAFEFNGSENIIREYRRSVVHWNNHYRGKTSNLAAPPDQKITSPFSTINSKAAGRLLAAGGIYNDNSQMFADTARKLGSETAKGFDEVLNEKTVNTLSIASVLLTGAKRGMSKFGTYRPTRTLPRDKYGNPVPDTDVPHTQLGTRAGRKEIYTQAREWGYDSKNKLVPKRDIDFTDHGRPENHPNPHQHDYTVNSSGGTLQHGPAKPLELPK